MTRRNKSESVNPFQLHGEHRLNKLLAAAGLGSRRQVDELIEQGRVEVDGVVVDHLGMKVDIDTAKVSVDGELLKRFKPVYYALNKPTGILCTNRDPQGRQRAVDLIPGDHRCFPVGRLDASSVGLLLMTNDGELTQRLTHPKHGVPKTYFVVVAGHIEPQQLRRLQRGIYLAEGIARVEGARIKRERKGATELEITLCEGKNREIRRVLARIGNKVVLLRRTSIGPLKLADLPEGAYRPLAQQEVAALYQAVEDAAKERKRRKAEREGRTGAEGDEASSAKRSGLKSKRPASTKKSALSESEVVAEKKTTKSKSPIKKKDKAEKVVSSDRDPFAWDDDDALLAASPFGDQFTSNDDDMDDDDIESSPFDGEDVNDADDLPAGMILVNEGGSPSSRGKVIDYYEDMPTAPSRGRTPRPRSDRPRTERPARGFKKGAGFAIANQPVNLKSDQNGLRRKAFRRGLPRKSDLSKKGPRSVPVKGAVVRSEEN